MVSPYRPRLSCARRNGRCRYEEDPSTPGNAPRWFELAGGEKVFSLTKDPVFPADFETNWAVPRTPTTDPRFGRGFNLWQIQNSEKMLPVTVDPVFFSAVG